MPNNVKLRPRMQRLLSPAVTQAELIGIIAWLGVLLAGPLKTAGIAEGLVTLGLLLVCGYHRVATNFFVWRVLGVVYMVLLCVGFFHVIGANLELRVFALPLAVTLVVSSALLFISVQDFLLCAALVWAVMWPILSESFYEGAQVYLFIFCAASVSIGFILSFSYLKNLRSVLLVESEFRVLAQTDYLTSILNRRALMESFAKLIAAGQSGYFLMLDIDSFKLKNDQFGHDVGDRILCAMADCLKATPGSHSFGRIGGEEFGVLLVGDDPSVASAFALRLLHNIRCSVAPPHHYTCSAGMTGFAAGADMSTVLKNADRNLYMAKRNGKDCVYLDGAPVREQCGDADTRVTTRV
ncbi:MULTISPECIES: GGDEF domain-containing protein [Pseudomonas]|uniref:GGDEF domain-containing protein n=1 Tax=Pseudomonas TaxID=286 RepID=UPI001AEA9866|nr:MULTISPECIES: GGDEF domain-containing protein [unclassified Pseudomonas]MBP1124157.1 diguanylate cyclase (GGDEF)-like protein [Pseudomonas sp. PvP025]MDQ0398017.1 diguanylate cyclase (GGDEF)-like protein [Pseudomonas sp. PvP006]